MAETLESSQYTSVQRRIRALEQAASSPASQGKSVDSLLSPLTIDEQNDSIGACANQTRQRCSDKGFLSMSIVDYLELLDASARMVRPDKTKLKCSVPVGLLPRWFAVSPLVCSKTERQREFPLHGVCSWLGNSPRIAQQS